MFIILSYKYVYVYNYTQYASQIAQFVYSEANKQQNLYLNALVNHCIYKLFDSCISINNNNNDIKKDYLLIENSIQTIWKDKPGTVSFIISQLAENEAFFINCTDHKSKAKYFVVKFYI